MAETAPIRLQTTRKGTRRQFESADAVAEWVAAERQAWSPLTSLVNPQPYGHQAQTPEVVAGRLILRELDKLTKAAARVTRFEEDEGSLSALQTAFASAYTSTLIASKTEAGRFVLAADTLTGKAARYFALTGAERLSIPTDTNLSGTLLTGAVEGVLFRDRLSASAVAQAAEELAALAAEHEGMLTGLHETHQQRLDELHADHHNRLGLLHDEQKQALDTLHSAEKERLDTLHADKQADLDRLRDERSHTLDLLTNSLRDATAAATKQQADAEEGFAAILADWEGRLATWEDRLKERLGLESPMSYWATKSKRHRRNARLAAWGAGIAGVSFAGVFIWLALAVLTGDTLTDNDYARIVALVTVATLMVWTLRILVRVLLSELHLQGDAAEREVILMTYTALDANEAGTPRLSDEDRRLLLAPVFRPAATGIVSDDSAPFSLAEIMSRVGSKP